MSLRAGSVRGKIALILQLWVSLYALSDQALTELEWGYRADVPLIKYVFAILRDVDGWGMKTLILAVGLGVIYWAARDYAERHEKWISGLSAFFAITTVFGISYYEQGNWNYIFHGRLQFGLAVFVMCGYFFLYRNLCVFLLHLLKQSEGLFRNTAKCKVEELLFERHSMLVPALVILLLGLPWIIAFWPGTLQEDTIAHIWQHFGLMQGSAMSPVGVTKLMGLCFVIGKRVFHSDNMGMFLYTGAQFLAQTVAFGYCIHILHKLKSPYLLRWFALFFFTVFPLFPIWGFTLVKDTGYYICIVYFTLALIDILIDDSVKNRWKWVLLFGATIGMSLFRNNGFYIALPVLLISMAVNRKRFRGFLAISIISTCFVLWFNNVYVPSEGFGPGPAKESMSLYLQATGRYLKEHMDEVTDEEREVLQRVFDVPIEELPQYYQPELSDGIKGHFSFTPTDEELAAYKRVWRQQFQKHPDTYLQAFLNHTYGYFYPDRKNFHGQIAYFAILSRERWEDDAVCLYFPEEKTAARDFFREYTELIYRMPVVDMLFSAGLHMYLIIGLSVCLIAKKRARYLTVLVPGMCMLFNIASPVDAYIRYMLPVIVVLPINLAWCYYALRGRSQNDI